jgi:chemotaxis family two-component system sensor kinase Cph1
MPTSSPTFFETASAGPRPGDHILLPYRADDDRDAAIAPFVRDGLARGERCGYAASAENLAAMERRLGAAGIDVGHEVRTGALMMLSAEQVYRPDGSFDPDGAIAFLRAELDRALADGFTGLRGAGEFDFPLVGAEQTAARRYEEQVSHAFVGRPFTALCAYCCTGASAAATLDMLHTHASTFIDGTVRDNPFFEAALLPAGSSGPSGAATRSLRAELQALRRALRDGVSPPAGALLEQIERIWIELRRLGD